MEKTIREKIYSKKGFTLAETLLAVLILLMVSSIVATGIPVARNAYEKVVLTSNARILLSTTISTLRNELGAAKDVEVTDAGSDGKGTTVTYYNATRDASSKIYKETTGKVPEIMFQRYFSDEDLLKNDDAYKAVPLISDAVATADLYVTYESVTYNKTKGIIQFTDLKVMRESGTDPLAKRDFLSIRVIMD